MLWSRLSHGGSRVCSKEKMQALESNRIYVFFAYHIPLGCGSGSLRDVRTLPYNTAGGGRWCVECMVGTGKTAGLMWTFQVDFQISSFPSCVRSSLTWIQPFLAPS